MRVIAGSAKGRRLHSARGLHVRPTADKVRGALFSILLSRYRLESRAVLDLFAGSGAIGIEALSRGAAHVTFVEQSSAAVRMLEANLAHCGFGARARVLRVSVQRALTQLRRSGIQYDGVFLDPPYGEGLVARTVGMLATQGLLRRGAWIMVEHHIDEPPPASGGLCLTQTRRYGKTGVTLLVMDGSMGKTEERMAARRAVYAGSFDPITNGHLDVVRRALQVFDEVIVAVASGTSDPQKDRALFSAEERVTMIREALADTEGRGVADSFSGLLVDYCERVGANVIIRGLRAVSDFEYEFQMAMMNHHLKPQIETFFMTSSEAYFYTASRLVKEVAGLGGDVSSLLPPSVYQRLLEKLRGGR